MPTVGDKAQTRASEAELSRLARRLRNRGVKVTVEPKKGSAK